jgi:hypothetical protein
MTLKEFKLDSGEFVNYDRLHTLLRKKYGNALHCAFCKSTTAKRYEWALLKEKNYSLNINDYIQLCPSCHRHYDKCYGNIGDIVRGKDSHQAKKIVNSDGIIFKSITEACEITGILRTSLSNCLNKRAKTAGKLKWEYYE